LGAARTGLGRNDGARNRRVVDHQRRQHRLGSSSESAAFHSRVRNAEFGITKLVSDSHVDTVGDELLGCNLIAKSRAADEHADSADEEDTSG
jgi:hypothetical protein